MPFRVHTKTCSCSREETRRTVRMEPATILVVDDLPDMRETLEDCLTAQGYRVVTAASAEAALALLATQAVDLVLTDVYMAAMTGIDLCARLKSDPRWHLLPVVILT